MTGEVTDIHEEIKGSFDIRALLWNDLQKAKEAENPVVVPISNLDFVVLECRDCKRIAHRLILKLCSPFFAEALKDNQASVSVPVTVNVLDHLIKYIYTSETIDFQREELIELYAVAKQFEFVELLKHLKVTFEAELSRYLRCDGFFSKEREEDVRLFAEVFRDFHIDERNKLKLIQRIHEWDLKHNPANSFGYKLISKVLKCTTRENFAITPAVYILQNEGVAEGEQRTTFSLRDVNTQKYLDCNLDFSTLSPLSVIRGEKVYATERCKAVVVYDVVSGEKIQEVELDDAVGVTLFDGEVYAWTGHDLFVVHEHSTIGLNLTKIASSTKDFLNVFLVKRDKDALSLAAETWDSNEVFQFSREKGKATFSVLREGKHRLAGAYKDHVFVVSCDEEYKTLLDIHNGEVVREYAIGRIGENWDCCAWGGNVYVAWEERTQKDSRNYWRIEVIDASNGNRHSIRTPVGGLKTCFIPALK